jgi:sulfoacetaldehyde acetyltransferase
VVLALGTRLNPFSTLPGYGIDYWPKDAKIIQVDHQPRPHRPDQAGQRRHRRRRRKVARAFWRQLADGAGDKGPRRRKATPSPDQIAWAQQLTSMDHEEDDPGTTWNERARADKPDWMSPRMAWRAIQAALPKEAIISSDIGNNCAIGNAYPSFEEGRKYLAPGLFGPCGYGLPSIVGAKIACPDVPVVGFAGDGAFGIAVNGADRHRPRPNGPRSPWSSSATTSGARKSGTRPCGTTTISSAPSWTTGSAMPASPRPAG